MFKKNAILLYRLVGAKAIWQTSLIAGLIAGFSSAALADTAAKSESQFKVVSCAADDVLTEKFRRARSRVSGMSGASGGSGTSGASGAPGGSGTSGASGAPGSSGGTGSPYASRASAVFQNSLNQPDGKLKREKFEWAGADAAYSIPVGTDKTLWLLGDTFLRPMGANADSKRVNESENSLQMINNSVAIQQIGTGSKTKVDIDSGPLKFFWRQAQNKNHSFYEDANANKLGHWLWPLDGICIKGKLFEFINEIRKSQDATPAFGFATSNQLLLKIEDIAAPIDKWKMTFSTVDAPNVQVGNAVTQDEHFVYIYCSYYPAKEGMNQHPQIVIRMPLESLDKTDGRDLFKTAEIWSRSKRWIDSSKEQPEIIMQDGAPEFSVTRVKGFDGYFAVYFPSGFGTKIMLRHASRPEGPWSEPQCIYDCPLDAEHFFVYSAKSHPELCTKDGELSITYCENIKSSDLSSLKPEKFYFPHAIKLQIESVTSRSELVH